jgi:hypothetical protein
METLYQHELAEYLEGSGYFMAFSKVAPDGSRVIRVPEEYAIRKDDLLNINTYEEFYNILVKLNFWIVRFYPNKILYWILDNIYKIDRKHLLSSILNDTDIVKQIDIILLGIYIYSDYRYTNTFPVKNYLTCEIYEKLNSCGYYLFGGLVHSSKYYDHKSENDYRYLYYDYRYLYCKSENYYDYRYLYCKFSSLDVDDMIMKDLTHNSLSVSYHKNRLHFLINGKYKCKARELNNKSDMHKIKQVEFKRVHNKKYFSKHIRVHNRKNFNKHLHIR